MTKSDIRRRSFHASFQGQGILGGAVEQGEGDGRAIVSSVRKSFLGTAEELPILSKAEQADGPVIPASASLPEMSVKAIVLGAILSILLGAANAYLGLFIAMTVSASIPASVISMSVLRLFKTSNILENNMVQTMASAGEGLAAGVVFTVPAILLLGEWKTFHYFETLCICVIGGVFGVFFCVPLRRAFIVEERLLFPEGIATAEVLKVGNAQTTSRADSLLRAESGEDGKKMSYMVYPALFSGLCKLLCSDGFFLWNSNISVASFVGNGILSFGASLSFIPVGVGYIVGLPVAFVMVAGCAISSWVALPIVAAVDGYAGDDAVNAAGAIHGDKTRYMGVGAMLVGGFWALWCVRKSLAGAIRSSVAALRRGRSAVSADADTPRTEKDMDIRVIFYGFLVGSVPLFFLFVFAFNIQWYIAIVMVLFILLTGFLFSAVGAYMAGIVGSSNNPISGVTIATVLCAALVLKAISAATGADVAPVCAVLIGSCVCCAAAIASDNMQDLKCGHLVGSTPWKQETMLAFGAICAAFVMAPVLNLLNDAYTVGSPSLQAPQAQLVWSVVLGIFNGGLPWLFIGIGVAVAVATILVDQMLERMKSSFRVPVMALAIGLYLTMDLVFTIILGGLLNAAISFAFDLVKKKALNPEQVDAERESSDMNGLLIASGLITGESLLGIAMAIPVVATSNADVLHLVNYDHYWPGILLMAALLVGYFYICAPKKFWRSLKRSAR
eukprot:GILK01006407.1.p1 GENE.GILK01006407.1~~GILK01006407.1.p1  ORF type:complete len:729 (+),score=121.88 GILK01006407.1:101-2287(+)